jgi:broad specificity phosphatase PhoE
MPLRSITPSSHPGNQHRLIVLVRHGRPNVDENIHPVQWSLSESGREAAKALGEKLKDRGFTFERIISSPEAKAVQTAEAIASSLDRTVSGVVVVVDAGLSEHARNHSNFLPREDFEASIARLFSADPSELVFGKETANAAVERFMAAIQRQMESSVMDVIAVTHGTILSLYLGRTLGIDSLPFWRNLKMPTAIVICGDQLEVIEAVGATLPENRPIAIMRGESP